MKKKNIILSILLLVFGVGPFTYGTINTELGDEPSVETATTIEENTGPDYFIDEETGEMFPLLKSAPAYTPEVRIEPSGNKLDEYIQVIGAINSIAMGWAMFYFNVVRPRRKEKEA